MHPRELSFASARARVRAAAAPLPEVSVPLDEARGRALRESITAAHPLPPFDNSAMDGFAVRAHDLERASGSSPVVLPVVTVLAAGSTATRALGRGEAARIMTGAPLPEGADAIVPFEECERLDGPPDERVRFTRAARVGDHVRRAGADVPAAAVVLEAGRELTPHDLALLAALGHAVVRVGPLPRVAIVSTGEELLRVDVPLRPGAIRDSNAPMLRALVEEVPCEVVSSEHTGDAPEEVGAHLRRAFATSDVTLSIGGVSAGDFDPVKASLGAIRGAESWRVAMKPGRPQAFAAEQGRLFFGLPGNPASVACVFETLVRPALRRLAGFAETERPRVRVWAAESIESRRGRTDFVRARLAWRDGGWWASPAGPQISGHLLPQARAHALLVIDADRERLATGDPAPAMLLRWPERPR